MIVALYLSGPSSTPMRSVDSVQATAHVGLVGDRHARAKSKPENQATFIEAEAIEAFCREHRTAFGFDVPRRNIVTRGVRLNDLVGRSFTVGTCRFQGIELCEPCSGFARRTIPAALRWFVGKGGLRAQVIASGTCRIGDGFAIDQVADETVIPGSVRSPARLG